MTAHAILLAATLAAAGLDVSQPSRETNPPAILPQEQKVLIEKPVPLVAETQAHQLQAQQRQGKLEQRHMRAKGKINRSTHRLDQRHNHTSQR